MFHLQPENLLHESAPSWLLVLSTLASQTEAAALPFLVTSGLTRQ